MKSDSPLFDRIRVKPDKDRRLRAERPAANGRAATAPATHRAPKGRLRENEYWRFCLDHVREYNHSYNFFAGMSTDDIAAYQKDAVTGHRPTWKMGMNGGRQRPARSHRRAFEPIRRADDPFGVFGEFGGAGGRERERRRGRGPRRPQCRAQGARHARARGRRHAGRDQGPVQVLVKRHHPDANGGDRSTEDRLREIIQAYNYLKSIGFR